MDSWPGFEQELEPTSIRIQKYNYNMTASLPTPIFSGPASQRRRLLGVGNGAPPLHDEEEEEDPETVDRQRQQYANAWDNSDLNWAFRTLGVLPGASVRTFTRAYRKLALKAHPDRRNGGDPETFVQLQHAYESLIERFGRHHLTDTEARHPNFRLLDHLKHHPHWP